MAQTDAEVVRPRTERPSRTITPSPQGNPMPVTIPWAIREEADTSFRCNPAWVAPTIRNAEAPQTRAWVRKPAGSDRNPRSSPTAEPGARSQGRQQRQQDAEHLVGHRLASRLFRGRIIGASGRKGNAPPDVLDSRAKLPRSRP